MNKLKGKIALVTGASRGVGKGTALELIDAGATVYITGRSVGDMQYILNRGIILECDHRNDEQVKSVFQQIADDQGRLDILVNNGKVLVAANVAQEYGFTDIDGKRPKPLTLNDI